MEIFGTNTDAKTLRTANCVLDSAVDEIRTIQNYVNVICNREECCQGGADTAPTPTSAFSNEDLAQYAEIIGDELNHIEKFVNMFIQLSGFRPKEE